ncbi:MAG: two-component system, response regulator PdtaR [Solirubrobacteraceae bacterium]|nr:two-component system, response regulator PdtaR [Solirubrobacteraceae bacterium]MEA2383810.1 two-component system, response regulator PdtaR [Solirubrobacteraceae bacterium]
MREAACAVIVLLHAPDPDFVKEASKRGVFAHISDADVEDWQSSIDIVLRRFAEYHDLQGAFGRRALTERAKGILMERHAIDEATAFEMLREQLPHGQSQAHRPRRRRRRRPPPPPQATARASAALTLQARSARRGERPGNMGCQDRVSDCRSRRGRP